MKTAARLDRVKPSPTLAVTAKAAELRAAGKDVIGLGAGEPDFDTPEHIRAAGEQAIRDGFTRYSPADGYVELKDAVIAKFQRENGLEYERDEVIVSNGAKQTLYNLCQALIGPGDEAVIPAPYWVSYPAQVLLAEGEPVIARAGLDQRFKLTPKQLESAITDKTKLVFLNSPSNPTGVAYSRKELEALAGVLMDHPHVAVVTDDIYEHIYWADEPFANILMVEPGLRERTVVVNGVSKAYAMTGWRIGYAAGPAALIKGMKKIQSQSTSGPSSPSQKAAKAALEGPQDCIGPMLEAFHQRHDFVVAALAELPGVEVSPGDGTFYSFPDFSGAIQAMDGVDDDTQLAEKLLEDAGVALVPGSAFGLPGHMRLSFATSMEVLEDALGRLRKALGG